MGISAVAILLIASAVKIENVVPLLSRLSFGYLLLALMSVVLNTLAKTQRWRILLGKQGSRIRFLALLNAILVGQLLNAILPVRVGDISRSVSLGPNGPGLPYVIGTIVIEKMIDVFCLAAIGILVTFIMPLPSWITHAVLITVLIAVCLCILTSVLILWVGGLSNMMTKVASWLPVHLHGKLNRVMNSILNSIIVLRNRDAYIGIAIWTFVVWITSISTNYLLAKAFMLDAPFTAALVLVVLLLVGVTLPSLPGGIGLFEYVVIAGLGLFGIDAGVAFLYGIMLHLLILLPMLIIGPTYLTNTAMTHSISTLIRRATTK